jgi:hypothetical protein
MGAIASVTSRIDSIKGKAKQAWAFIFHAEISPSSRFATPIVSNSTTTVAHVPAGQVGIPGPGKAWFVKDDKGNRFDDRDPNVIFDAPAFTGKQN